jgi:hypothetical protein
VYGVKFTRCRHLFEYAEKTRAPATAGALASDYSSASYAATAVLGGDCESDVAPFLFVSLFWIAQIADDNTATSGLE